MWIVNLFGRVVQLIASACWLLFLFLSLAFLVADSNPSWFLTQVLHFLGLQFLTHSFRLMPCQFPTRTFPLSDSAPCQTNSFMFSGAKVRCSCCVWVSWYHPILLFIAFCLSAPQCPNLLPQEPHDSFWNLFLQVYSLRRVTVLITLHFVHFRHDVFLWIDTRYVWNPVCKYRCIPNTNVQHHCRWVMINVSLSFKRTEKGAILPSNFVGATCFGTLNYLSHSVHKTLTTFSTVLCRCWACPVSSHP